MKLVILGDTHGRKTWEAIVKQESDADKFVFMGDYFDSWDFSTEECLQNFYRILHFKTDHPDKVILLYGNHEHHYQGLGERYSGYQTACAPSIRQLLERYTQNGTIQLAYINGEYLFSHAGFTKSWCELNGVKSPAMDANNLLWKNPKVFNFCRADTSGFGDHEKQSPIWVRPDALKPDMISGYVQVVGHTTQEGVTQDGDLLWLVDAIHKGEYLIVKDGVPSIGVVDVV